MLLQSHVRSEDGIYMIDLLPAVPDVWKTGTITGLRARGGFGVDIAWKKGMILEATISSSKGGQALVRTNGNIRTIILAPNESAIIKP